METIDARFARKEQTQVDGHEEQLRQALKKLWKDQSVQIIFQYCANILHSQKLDNLNEYTPTQIYKLILEPQIQELRKLFQQLPQGHCQLEHFLIIMIKAMNFPFEKCPHYLVGLMEMFQEICEPNSSYITFDMLFKALLGETVSFKDQEQNTQFQVHMEEQKKQDYLLHDNGIKKVCYLKELDRILTLDDNSSLIKVFNDELKTSHRFSPSPDRHNRKFPIIKDFAVSKLSLQLGALFSDSTLAVIDLAAFLAASPKSESEQSRPYEVEMTLPMPMESIYFMEMTNRWAVVSTTNRLFLVDTNRAKQLGSRAVTQVSLPCDQKAEIQGVYESMHFSCICVVANNEIYFYDEKLEQEMYPKFTHGSKITVFRNCEENNLFYFCGVEKAITVLSLQRNSKNVRFWSISTNRPIMSFDVFPHFGTLVVSDDLNDVKLYAEADGNCFQSQNYSAIVKDKRRPITIWKVSKNAFALAQTYLLMMSQEKVAIERDHQFNYSPDFYFDQSKEEVYLSVNNQIVSFSPFYGEMRQSFSAETSNVTKHSRFFLTKKAKLFVLDYENRLYDLYHREEAVDGERRTYRKKLVLEEVIGSFYDDSSSNVLIFDSNGVSQVKNDGDNNFNVRNSLTLKNGGQITLGHYCDDSRYLHVVLNYCRLMQVRSSDYQVLRDISFQFPLDSTSHQERIITKYIYNHARALDLIFTNTNELYLLAANDVSQQFYMRLDQFVPRRLKESKFKLLSLQNVHYAGNDSTFLLFANETGESLEIDFTNFLNENFPSINKLPDDFKTFTKDSRQINLKQVTSINVILEQNKKITLSNKFWKLQKAHDKEIALMRKVTIELLLTLTVGQDGYVKLWTESGECLCSLKLPSLNKQVWKMGAIEEIKSKRSCQQLLQVFDRMKRLACDTFNPMASLYHYRKRIDEPFARVNPLDPIQIEIENKELEEILNENDRVPKNVKIDLRNMTRKRNLSQNAHPWRGKSEFKKIYQQASPRNKYKKPIPLELLLLRNSLDMEPKLDKTFKLPELLILPQLKNYEPEQRVASSRKNRQDDVLNAEEQDIFQNTCVVKTDRKPRKKIDEFDEIDKEFNKKSKNSSPEHIKHQYTRRTRTKEPRTMPNFDTSVIQLKQTRQDPMQSIISIFEAHNRASAGSHKAHIIKIPIFETSMPRIAL